MNGRLLEVREYSWNLICSFVVPVSGRITAVIEIARDGGSSAVTHIGLVSCARGGVGADRGRRDHADRKGAKGR